MNEAMGWCLCVALLAQTVCLFALKVEIEHFKEDVNNTLRGLGLVVVKKAKEDANRHLERNHNEHTNEK